MLKSTIENALQNQFQKHRIVFWYDVNEDMGKDFEALNMPGVEKIYIQNNQFRVKYRILREEPDKKFLLYHKGPPPNPIHNWLLDVQLAHGLFKGEKLYLLLSELELGPEYWETSKEHEPFFDAISRREGLQRLWTGKESNHGFRLKMIAACAGVTFYDHFDRILENLLREESQEKDNAMRDIERCGLAPYLWEEMANRYGYTAKKADIRDFALKLFQTSYRLGFDEAALLSTSAAAFMNRWKDSLQHQESFETLSEEYAELLEIREDLQNRSAQDLVNLDYFRGIDKKILSDLVHQIAEKTISSADCEKLIWQRRGTHWYAEFEDIYQAIKFGTRFLSVLEKTDLTIKSLDDGFHKYTQTWYELDRYYRKCIYNAQASKQVSLLEYLLKEVENHYSNTFLLEVNDQWQQFVDGSNVWSIPNQITQEEFFDVYVEERFLRENKKIVVIISDALRYEIGAEFVENIRGEDRYEAELESVTSILPSVTSFGMAALLPHKKLTFKKDGAVLVDGMKTQSTQDRNDVLTQYISEGAKALTASTLSNMNWEDRRVLFRENQLIYIYHNQIDAIGEVCKTEHQAFKAAEDAILELVDIVKKLTSANATNIIITADHGFIYQNEVLDESDFVHLEELKGEVFKQTRRYILSPERELSARLKHFRPVDLGYEGEADVHMAKSINRLRLKGAGSKFVHGGSALQEITLPVILINKKKETDVDIVDVDILGHSSPIISTGQVTVSFYQDQPVSAKCQPRVLRAGIYAKDGTPISDVKELTFDLTSEDKREREVKETFILRHNADQYNGQEVILKLEENILRSDIPREYKSRYYKLQRSFTSDFNF